MGSIGILIGTSLGFIGKSVDYVWKFLILIGVMLFGMLITISSVTEEKATGSSLLKIRLKSFCKTFWNPLLKITEFRWLIATFVCIQLGLEIVRFIGPFYNDILKEPVKVIGNWYLSTASIAHTFLYIPMACGAMISSLIIGKLTDVYKRRALLVSSCSIIMTVLPLVLIITNYYFVHLLFSLVFGLGFGGFITLIWYLAVSSLRKAEMSNGAQSLALWKSAGYISQIVCHLVFGFLIEKINGLGKSTRLGYPQLGYAVSFGCAGLLFILGAVLIWRAKEFRRAAS